MDQSASVGREITPELIAGLKQQIFEIRIMVMQSRTPSQTHPNMTLPPDTQQKGPMFPTSEAVDQKGHFAHTSQNTPFVYTFSHPKVHTISLSHQASPVYTYSTAPLVTQTPGLYHLDANHYVEIENDPRMYTDDMVNRNLKVLRDAMRSLRGLRSNQSVKYKEFYAFLEIEISIIKLKQKSYERFRKYTIHWREEATKPFERLKDAKLLHPVEAKPVNTSANWYDPNKRCTYHSRVVGHDIEKYITLKYKIQDLIDNKVITLEDAPANVKNNPFPNHKK
ncbi:hypothetical protein FXO38_14222 [Capsicum annuum]|nr:hypothetical protein FXO37_27263 [Capsicum annuum]KAF3656255.1 hypothetical protein FXO38_14222 [Capsicum annuum]